MFWAELGAVGCRVISELRVEGFGDFWLSSVDDSFASWLKLRKLNDINGEASVVVVEVEPSSGSNVCGRGCSDEKKVLVGSGVKVLKLPGASSQEGAYSGSGCTLEHSGALALHRKRLFRSTSWL